MIKTKSVKLQGSMNEVKNLKKVSLPVWLTSRLLRTLPCKIIVGKITAHNVII